MTAFLPTGVHFGSTVYMFCQGFIFERILAVVLAELPAEKYRGLLSTKHQGGTIEYDGFLLTLDPKTAAELRRV
jgi:hypothetical protein